MVKTSKKSSKNTKVKSKNTKLDKNKGTKKDIRDNKTVNKAKLTKKAKTTNRNNINETENGIGLEGEPVEYNKNEQEDNNETKTNKKFKILDLLFNNNSSSTYLDVKEVDNLNTNYKKVKTNIAKTKNNVPIVKDTTIKLVENKELNEILNRFLKNLCQITEKILVNNLNYNEGFAILLKDVNLIKSTITPKLDTKSNLNGNHNTVSNTNNVNNKLANEVINILYEKLLLIVIYTCKYFVSGKYANNTLIENMTNLLYKLTTHIFDELILDNSEDDSEHNQNKLLLYIWDILLLLVNCKDKKLRKNFLVCLQVIVNNSCLDEIIINSKLYKKHIFNILSLIVNATKTNTKETRDKDSDLVLYKLLQSFQIKDVLDVLLSNLNNNTSSDVKTLIINIINITDNNVLNNIISRLNDNDPRVKAEVYKKLYPLFNNLNTDYVVHIFQNFLLNNTTYSNTPRLNKNGDNKSSDSYGNNEVDLEEEFYNMLTNWIANMNNTNNLELQNLDKDSTNATVNGYKDNNKNTLDKINKNNSNTDNNTNKLVEFINHLFKNTLQLTSVLNVLFKYVQYLTNKYNENNIDEEELVIYNQFTNSINSNNILLYIYNTLQVDTNNKFEVDMEKLIKELKVLVNSEDLKEGNQNMYLVVNNLNIILVLIYNYLTATVPYSNNNRDGINKNKDKNGNKDNNSKIDNKDDNNNGNSDFLSELESVLVKLIKLAPLKSIVIKLINEYIELTNLNFNHSLNNGYLLANNLMYYVLLALFTLIGNNNLTDNYKNGLLLENVLNGIFDPHNINTIKKIRIDFNNVKLIRNIKEISKFDFSNYSINQLIQFTNQINSKLTLYNNNNNILKNILKNNKDNNNNLVNKELNENLVLINKYKTLLDKINTELNGRYTAILLLVYVYFNLPNSGGDLGMVGVMDNSGNMYNISGTTNTGNLELVNRIYSKYILNVLRMYTGTNLDNNKNTLDKINKNNSSSNGGLEYYNNVLLLKILCVYNFVLFNSNYSDIETVTSNIRNELNVYHILFTNIIESIGTTRSTKANKQLNEFVNRGNDIYVYKLEVVLKIMVDLLYLLAGPIPGGANGLVSPTQSPPSNPSLYTPTESPINSPKLSSSPTSSSKLVENILKGMLQIFNGDTVVNNYIYSILIKLLPKILYVTINNGNSNLLGDYSSVIVELLIFYRPNSPSNSNSLDTISTTNPPLNNNINNYYGNNNNSYGIDRLQINNYDLGILQSTLSYLYNNNVDMGNTLNRIILTTFYYYSNNLNGVSYVLSNVKYFLINLINLSTNSRINSSRTDINDEDKDYQDKTNVINIIVNILVILLKANKYTNINELLLVINFIINKNFISFDKNNKTSSNKDNETEDNYDYDMNNNNNAENNINYRNINLNNIYILLKYYYLKHTKHYKNNKLLLFILNQLNPNSDTKLTQNEQSTLSSILKNHNKIYIKDKNELLTKKPYCKHLLIINAKNTNKMKRKRLVDLDTSSSSGCSSYIEYDDYEEDSFVTDSDYHTDTTY